MKITHANINLITVNDDDACYLPFARQPQARQVITVSLRAEGGINGIGVCYGYRGLAKGLLAITRELADCVVGESLHAYEHIHKRLSQHAATFADCGLFLTALSAIDVALWDLKGKYAELPWWRLLGGTRQRITTYASGPLHRGLSDEQVVEQALELERRGFGYIKLHLGLDGPFNLIRELQRARAVKDALSPTTQLMCDINERWAVGDATAVGAHLAALGLYCIEDPIHHHDYRGLAAITQAVPTRIMAGENWWGPWSFQHALAERSMDIAMIDLQHVGGVTGWMKVATMAAAHHVPVVSHIMPEFQAHLVAAAPNGLMCEHKEWTWGLFEHLPVLINGQWELSERHGHGLVFSAANETLN
ncbi:mandelate racemase/muconate lactonizing enzyme family protein [Pseudomonas typographi]|uniref:Mandelate racemase/muconate lactonizing enzyme family protein n=1 Tax=Pseudomonas typographi TaxID=2715964 RepID=A0ABR7Z0G6_9PSED|nr:mandelate racemase/muconate lactonizing enzyme family protein [Pseudomonas typographi]MBD1589288.1 mandelate racemase/muconate lactonizing enzyme family protein [Pseudomonas typographi]MBD1598965.1 mandelate racemase/muconate lactonizing enzyme family protein [Pseudomonas typographi]